MEKLLLVALRKAVQLLLFVCACTGQQQVQDNGRQFCEVPFMGIFCHITAPGKVRSTSNTMWIRFLSDSCVSGASFEVTYTTATSDRTTATSDQTTAKSNWTTATSDWTTATSNWTTATSDRTTTPHDETTATNNHTVGTSDSTRATSNRTTSEYVKTSFYSTTANVTAASEIPQPFYVTWKSDSKEHLYISTTNMIITVACAAAAALASAVVVVVVVALRKRRRKPTYGRSCEKPVSIAGKAGNLRADYSALFLHRDYEDKKQSCLEFRPNDEVDDFQDSQQDPGVYLHH